ncbi:MAG: hypothetical protein K2N05_06805 [Muribaculaceae bacterium]|nr:hypothetical protein [Muribaculaceae bacterium]
MTRFNFISILSGFMFFVSLLCSCASDNLPDALNPQDHPDNKLIQIVGGKPTGLPLTSRAEPSQPGQCNADRLQIWEYKGKSSKSGNTPTLDQITELSRLDEIDVLRFGGENFNDKVATRLFTPTRDSKVRVGYIFSACAYTSQDKDNFEFTTISNFQNLGITLKSPKFTPELYFGHLYLKTSETGKDSVFHYNKMSILRGKNENQVTQNNPPEGSIFGKLYRIVSQFNITVTDVDINNVDHLEMYISNLPMSITLWGDHGEYYPITAASASKNNDQHIYSNSNNNEGSGEEINEIMVASTSQFNWVKDKYSTDDDPNKHTYSATLSTFMLPSEIGRRIMIRVHYKPGTLTDENGEALPLQFQDFDIRPSQNYFLSGEDASIYQSGVRKFGSDIFIYDQQRDEFYSVANVKVNISGKFDKIFSPTQEVDVQIEVCPAFEASHEFEF